MIENKIVIHYADKRLQKGITSDFSADKESFHIKPVGFIDGNEPPEVHVPDLKAVFFVKDFAGNPKYNDRKEFDPDKPVIGRKIKVLFKDGELIVGTTTGYKPDRPGFFVVPADSQSNIERCFVVTSATKEIRFM